MAIDTVTEGPPQAMIATQNSLNTARMFQIIVTDPANDTAVWLRQQTHADIPTDGASYSSAEPWLRAVDRRITGRFPLYIMTVNYRTPHASGTQQQAVDPLAEPPDIAWATEPRTVTIDQDIYGSPITNSAGEELTPLPTREVADCSLTIGINQATWNNRAVHQGYINRVNDVDWMGYPATAARLRIANANRIRFGSAATPVAFYWRATYQVTFRYLIDPSDGEEINWQLRFLQQGFREFDLATETYRPILKDGKRITKAWPLNTYGVALSDTAVREGTRFWGDAKRYESANFQSLFEPLGIIE